MQRLWILFSLLLLPAPAAPPRDLPSRELRLEIKEAESRVGNRIDETEKRLDRLDFKADLLLTLLATTLAGIIPAYFLLLRKTKKRVEEKLNSLIESRPRALLALIDEREANLRLRQETPILVIADKLETEALLRGSGFRKVTTRGAAAEDLTSHFAPTTVLVFDLDNGCPETTAAQLVTGHHLDYFLVYTAGRTSLRGRYTTAANSPATLFARLMELIELKAALEREGRLQVL